MATFDDCSFVKEKKYPTFRVLWLFLYIILAAITIALVATLWSGFLTNPTITTLETTYHPVTKLPFPGVGICNMNKISKKRAMRFAQFMAQETEIDVDEIFNATQVLGKLYDFNYDIGDEASIEILEMVLEKLDLNLITIMQELAPNCDDLLKQCRWKGKKVNCSDIFLLRSTYDGYCCAFNYVKKAFHFNYSIPTTVESCEEGITKGLSVVVDIDIDDYLYAPLNSEGATVQIFIPTDYPDKTSGNLVEVMAEADTETFLKVVPTTVHTVKDVINYPLSKRQCLFDSERKTEFHDLYSQSDCNVDCRIASTLALCQCIPFMIPLSTKETVCTVTNLACLNQYKNKWNFLYPEEDELGLLQREMHDSLRCSHRCYPSCDGTSYEVVSDRAPIHRKHNHTVIHIYYGRRFSELYKHDVVYYWFEILSNFGGTFGLIMGLSIISIAECLIASFQILKKRYGS